MIEVNKTYYITTAIAYPNGKPHQGHALEIIQADAISRFNKLLGKDVYLQTGTDEHGVKNWETAKKANKKIYDFLDENVAIFKKLYKDLNISYDNFIRTSDQKIHYPAATKLWNELVKSGDIYKKQYTGLYCKGCESFKTEKELEDGICPNHPTRQIQQVEEENYFFKLSKYKDQIYKIIEKDEYHVHPISRKNEILSFLKEAKDISFSRPNLPWGIPVPNDSKQVMYVWCDALSNYITGIGYENNQELFNKLWPADIHIIGKDILRFHAAFWPAMLLSANLPLPKKLFVHGFILSKGLKMGKSTGNMIEPFSQIENYGVDAYRFYILSSMPLDGDGEYSEEILQEKLNNELVANLGNLAYRVLSFLQNNFNSEFSDIEEDELFSEIIKLSDIIKQDYEIQNFNSIIKNILSLSTLGNRYFQDNEPWKLIKEDKEKAQRVLGSCINIVKILSILTQPIMPTFSEKLQEQLALKNLTWNDINFNLKNHKIFKASPLFKKYEEEQVEKFPLNLKVAKILEVNDHPDADKLYVLKIDLGEERQLVAGLKEHYTKEELLNKKIVVVSNLKKAKLRGIESQGMLLAGEEKDQVGVLFSNQEPGTLVSPDGLKNNEAQIKYEEFAKLDLNIKDGKAYFQDKILKADDEEICAEKIKNGEIH